VTPPGVKHRVTELAKASATRTPADPAAPEALVPSGGRFEGLVTFQGDVVVAGEVAGEVHGAGRLEVSESAHIHGDIVVEEILIAGTVDGDVRASRCIAVRAGATVRGTLEAPYMVMDDGCAVEARCIMRIEGREHASNTNTAFPLA
jgi:cytoskeletal protein CcmA (bactofilin family)